MQVVRGKAGLGTKTVWFLDVPRVNADISLAVVADISLAVVADIYWTLTKSEAGPGLRSPPAISSLQQPMRDVVLPSFLAEQNWDWGRSQRVMEAGFKSVPSDSNAHTVHPNTTLPSCSWTRKLSANWLTLARSHVNMGLEPKLPPLLEECT